jgi:hypothetical protein
MGAESTAEFPYGAAMHRCMISECPKTCRRSIQVRRVNLSGFLAHDDAIVRLERVASQAAAAVWLRFYARVEPPEVAKAAGASERAVRREWAFGRGRCATPCNATAPRSGT